MAADALDRKISSLIKKLRNIRQIEVPRANAAALNQVGRRSRTRIVAGVSKSTRVPQKEIRKKSYLGRATAKKQTARLTGYVKPISAVKLLTRNQIANKVGTGTNKRGVSAKGYNWPGAFLQRGSNQNVHVFRRKGARRYPIEKVTVDVARPFARNMQIVPRRVMKSDYRRLLAHELGYRLNKYTKQ